MDTNVLNKESRDEISFMQNIGLNEQADLKQIK